MTIHKTQYWVIIPAAGIGKRLGFSIPKQYLLLNNKTIIENTVECFIEHPQIKKIIVALNLADTIWPTLELSNHPRIATVNGGELRCHSVLNSLLYLKDFAKADDWVLVHDAVRPCLQREDINKLIVNLIDHPVGGLLGVSVRDTLKRVDESGNVLETVARENIWHALTPQMFRFGKLLTAMQRIMSSELETRITDEASAMELMDEKPLMIAGRSDNIKITYPEDLLLAEKILGIDKIGRLESAV